LLAPAKFLSFLANLMGATRGGDQDPVCAAFACRDILNDFVQNNAAFTTALDRLNFEVFDEQPVPPRMFR
jgi:hypothetical protein